VKINRKHLSYASLFFVAFFSYKALEAEQWLLSSGVLALYLSFIFGVDKFVLDWKNKKVEIDDSDKK
jgi:hypothetical protein